jgi:hypothetical protein
MHQLALPPRNQGKQQPRDQGIQVIDTKWSLAIKLAEATTRPRYVGDRYKMVTGNQVGRGMKASTNC